MGQKGLGLQGLGEMPVRLGMPEQERGGPGCRSSPGSLRVLCSVSGGERQAR